MNSIPPKVKICCISSLEEAKTALDYGAYALGLVGPMPSGPGVISNDLIAEIAAKVPANVETFLLSSETEVEKIIAQHESVKTTTLQLVDTIQNGTYQELKSALPTMKIVQVIHVLSEASIDQALRAAEGVDFLLLDSGNPNLQIKELGGTGRTHNWAISRKIVEQSSIPVFLAGGLHAANVKAAIAQVQPYGVDVCSGVRTAGKLDVAKLEAFFAQVNTP